jgi:hypothetical protein
MDAASRHERRSTGRDNNSHPRQREAGYAVLGQPQLRKLTYETQDRHHDGLPRYRGARSEEARRTRSTLKVESLTRSMRVHG